MTINKETDGSKLLVKVEGRLDTTTAPELDKELKALDGVTELVLDFADLQYISSAGLRVLLLMHKACTGGVSLYGETETVREILEQTGFDSIFH